MRELDVDVSFLGFLAAVIVAVVVVVAGASISEWHAENTHARVGYVDCLSSGRVSWCEGAACSVAPAVCSGPH